MLARASCCLGVALFLAINHTYTAKDLAFFPKTLEKNNVFQANTYICTRSSRYYTSKTEHTFPNDIGQAYEHMHARICKESNNVSYPEVLDATRNSCRLLAFSSLACMYVHEYIVRLPACMHMREVRERIIFITHRKECTIIDD